MTSTRHSQPRSPSPAVADLVSLGLSQSRGGTSSASLKRMTEQRRLGRLRFAAFLSVLSLAVLTSMAASGAGADQGATALPPKVSEYLKATLPADADKIISVLGEVRNPQSIRPEEGITVSKAIE